MPKRTPTSPVSAHHRITRALVGLLEEPKGLNPTPKELDRVCRVFERAGGSWEKLFKGSLRDLVTLRTAVKVAARKGLLAKADKWS